MKDKPLVSFLVLSYKQEKFIRDAIKGAFEQTYEPLEIIFSDDCSPDRTFEIIKDEVGAYRGLHKIILNRNEHNQGLAGNMNRALELSHGQFIIASAGDDISLPNRTMELADYWQSSSPPVDLVCSYYEEMNEDGSPTGFINKNVVFVPDTTRHVQQWSCGATGACAAYSRKLYDKYGPLDTRIVAEDWVFSFRAWVESGIRLIEKPLVLHRTHDQCLSVIHHNLNVEQNPAARRLLRRKAKGNELARVKDWLQAWQIAGKSKGSRVETELKKWIRLLEMEWQAYDTGRIQALKAAILSLGYRGGLRTAIRLLYRLVLGRY
jgi:glycosyltransferase involved in cell wall biosynthesis